ncbi:hypothetical protein SMI01S_30640 [Sphingobacterium mizutaii NBRC 14946 = DSM 11724]|uniref:Beta-carotene 15,15'-monooxygenase n=2 Tax=Sphingobacterium mizutaii TaxID=1010 RepID=A0AAJ4X9Y3_9SPHI|nr:DUF6427 family protein [Sphingobacterium mizutaii]GEM69458.1 hypothetical protein SMI01S_30640 [Sphingobacterium mizutaii NBRC 14946 = DSM 11724]SDL72344.1 hypothetical protein SAMN05192578_107119 [Sphingobacterium mizutaii]SNV41262.1 Uncharacterised protein [Sphingobacterium mizutaii]
MLINQHRTLSGLNVFLVIFVGTVLCLGVFYHLPEKLTPVLFEPGLDRLAGIRLGSNFSPTGNVLITLVLTLLQAFSLNRVVNHFNLLGKPSFLTALMFMTLVSLFIPFLVLSPTLICNFITIWMLQKLFNIYKHVDIKGIMFDLGLLVALGSLIYFPFIVMLLLIWSSLVIFRPFYWREWITPLLGVITVYFLLAVAYFWLERMDEFYQIFLPFTYAFPTKLNMDVHDYFVLIPIVISLGGFLFILKDNFFKSVVQIRKSFQLLFIMLLLIFGSFYLNEERSINHFLLCVPPLSIYLAYFFTHAKVKWFYETLYLVILSTIIYFQFF